MVSAATFDFVAIREAIAEELTGLGFSTLPYDPNDARANYATVSLPDEVLYHQTFDGQAMARLVVTLYVGQADEASANRMLDLAISWRTDGAIPFELERRCRDRAAAPWRMVTVEAAGNRRSAPVASPEFPGATFLAIDLMLRIN